MPVTTFLLVFLAAALLPPLSAEYSIKPEIIEGLMVESLRNNFVQACDNEKVTLHCPRNTHILIENAFYGRLVPSTDLCPAPGAAVISPSNEDTTCVVSQAQAKLSELCRNKRKCKVLVKSSFFDADPCPTTSKYLQISYKCKPISFEDQNFCEGSEMQLSCKAGKRLSVYSANYGRIANGQSMQCPNNPSLTDTQPVYKDCVSDVLPQVLLRCHAQTECSINVEDAFLGAPCPHGVRKYLSLIFMCVNDEVFSEAAVKGNLDSMRELEREVDSQQPKQAESKMAKDAPIPAFYRPPNTDTVVSDAAVPDMEAVPGYDTSHNVRIHPVSEDDFGIMDDEDRLPNAVGFANDVMLLGEYIKDNKEQALLYFLLAISLGVVLLLSACVYQQWRARHAAKRSTARSHDDSMRFHLAKSPELSSLIGGSSNTSPMFFDSDTHSRMGLDMGDGNYMRFAQVTPPRIPTSLQYYA